MGLDLPTEKYVPKSSSRIASLLRGHPLQTLPPGQKYKRNSHIAPPRSAKRPWGRRRRRRRGDIKEILLYFRPGGAILGKFPYISSQKAGSGEGCPLKSEAILLELSGTYFSVGRSTPVPESVGGTKASISTSKGSLSLELKLINDLGLLRLPDG